MREYTYDHGNWRAEIQRLGVRAAEVDAAAVVASQLTADQPTAGVDVVIYAHQLGLVRVWGSPDSIRVRIEPAPGIRRRWRYEILGCAWRFALDPASGRIVASRSDALAAARQLDPRARWRTTTSARAVLAAASSGALSVARQPCRPGLDSRGRLDAGLPKRA